jgi:chemotaxis signal transduction protein
MNERIFTFWVGEQIYGMPLLLVGEFCPLMQFTDVEVGDPRVPGVAHVRGTTAVVLDMRRVLGTASDEVDRSKRDRIFVLPQNELCDEGRKHNLKTYEEPIVLEIDRLGSIMDIDMNDLHATPAHLTAEFYRGVFEMENGDLLLLEYSKLIECLNNELKKGTP